MADEIDPRVRVIYEESVRGLNMQSASLDEIRTRTGVLIAAATVGAAFLGATALQHHDALYWANLLGMITFVAVIFACIAVLWPDRVWEFSYSARTLDGDYFQGDIDAQEMLRSMADGNATSWIENSERLQCRYTWFRVASAGLVVDIVLWLISIGIR